VKIKFLRFLPFILLDLSKVHKTDGNYFFIHVIILDPMLPS